MSNFIFRVRNGEISHPTQKSFTLAVWKDAFLNEDNPSDKDQNLYETGEWIFRKLEAIRNKLLPFSFENVSRETFLRTLASSLNLTAYTLAHMQVSVESEKFVFIEQTFQASLGQLNKLDPNSTPDMVLTSSIDGARYAIRQALTHKNTSLTTISDGEVINRINAATLLGSFYDTLESYWMQALWNGWTIISTEEAEILSPPKNIFTDISAVSEYRRQVLSGEFAYHSSYIWNNFIDEELKHTMLASVPKVRIKGLGKKRKYEISTRNTDDIRSHLILNKRVIADKGYYFQFFDLELPKVPQTSLKDLVGCWEVFEALATSYLDNLPPFKKGEVINTLDELLKFSPIIYFEQLSNLLKKWLNFSSEKIERIIKFFTFSHNSTTELWAQPLIKLDDKRYILLWSPVVYGNIERTVELWMKESGLDLSEKGFLFEDYSRQSLHESLSESPVLKDAETYRQGVNLTGTVGKEEIDLVIRIGTVVLLGEIKCILFPSEPIERARYFEILKDASKQVQRKVLFANENQKTFRDQFNLPIHLKDEEIKFYPFILVNQPFGSGFVIDEVPVADLLILERFFSGEWYQMVMFDGRNEPEAMRTIKLYDSETQASETVMTYLNTPPQLNHYRENIGVEVNWLPILNKGDKPIGILQVKVSLPLPNIDIKVKESKWR